MKFRLTTKPAANASSIELTPVTLAIRTRPLRILDFDCECRPLAFMGGDYVSKDITAIAWAWTDHPEDVTCYLLGEVEQADMLRAFLHAYEQADMVTGHYIRGFDLPLVNGALTEHHLPALGDKLSHDTKLDLLRRSGISGSQESIGAMLGLDHPKVQMDQHKWRAANRLEPEGLAWVRERVIGDVQQHIEMRRRLLELGYLARPKMWYSRSEEPVAPYAP